jgi:ABC-type nitrate/sulfonate/bicarbonate transport system substrate-binding protein
MSEPSTDHDAIRQWADSHGGKPAAVERTHSEEDVGLIRIMFPDAPNSHHDNLVEITWDEFFEEFEKKGLALVFSPNSNFSKLVKREGA